MWQCVIGRLNYYGYLSTEWANRLTWSGYIIMRPESLVWLPEILLSYKNSCNFVLGGKERRQTLTPSEERYQAP